MAFSNHVKVLFGADTKGFQKGLQQASTQTNKFADTFKSKMAGLLGGALFIKATKDTINFGAEIGDLSSRLGVTAEFLQKMQYASEQNGSSAEQASKALEKLSRSIGEADIGSKLYVDTFAQLGVAIRDSSGALKSTEQILMEVSDGLKNTKDPAIRLKNAMDLMGRSGSAMLQFMKDGSANVQKFGKQAEDLGVILGNDNVKALQDASGALEEMGRSFKTLLATGAKPISGAVKTLNSLLQGAIGIVKDYGGEIVALTGILLAGKIKTLAMSVATGTLTLAQSSLGLVIGGNARSMKLFLGAMKAVALRDFTKATKALRLALASMNVVALANPFVLFLAGITAILAPLYLFQKRIGKTTAEIKEMEKLAVGKLQDNFTALQGKVEQAKNKVAELKKELNGVAGTTIELPLTKQLEDAVAVQEKLLEKQKKLQGFGMQFDKEQLQRAVEDYEAMLNHVKERGDSELKVIEYSTKLEKSKQALLDIQTQELEVALGLKNNAEQQAELAKKIADEETARVEQLEHLFDGTAQHIIDLKRETELLEALKKGGKKLAEETKERHKFEDMVKKLYEKGNISLKEAVDHVSNRLAVGKEINLIEGQINAKAEKKAGLDEAEIQRAKDLLEQRKQNKKAIENELAVLELRAKGDNDLADALEKQLEMREQALEIAEKLGVNEAKGIELVEKRAFLLKEASQKELDAQAERIKADNVMLWAQTEIDRKTTRADRRRIRSARRILRWEEQIRKLKDHDDPWSQRELKRLEALKNQEMKLVIDDQAKEALDGIAGEKVKLEDQHKAQMKALNDRLAEIKKQEAQMQAKANQEKEKIAQAGKAQVADNAKALNEIAQASVDKIKSIAENMVINVPPAQNYVNVSAPSIPPVNNSVNISIESDMKQETQEEILSTLQGQFVNQ